MARQITEGKQQQQQRPPRASVPAFGGWEGGAQPDYSLDFTKIRVARMQRRRKALSWSSFVGNAAAAEATGGADEDRDDRHQYWSSAASEGGDDDDRERRRRHRPCHRRLRSDDDADRDDDRQPIRPGRADPKGRGKFKGYLFGCVGGLW